MSNSEDLQQNMRNNLPAIGATVRNIIIFIAVMSIPLTVAREGEESHEKLPG